IHDPVVLAKIVADLKSQSPGATAVTGDLTNIALPQEFVGGRGWLAALGAPADVTVIPGNHDAYVRAAAAEPERHWGDFMHGDDGAGGFPFVRRRGPLALIGLSTAVPTAPFMATGRRDDGQLAGLGGAFSAVSGEPVFRVVLIHHPPISQARRHKR